MINLEEHKIYVESHKMDMVPLSVAKQAIQEAVESNPKLDEAMSALVNGLAQLNKTIEDND